MSRYEPPYKYTIPLYLSTMFHMNEVPKETTGCFHAGFSQTKKECPVSLFPKHAPIYKGIVHP